MAESTSDTETSDNSANERFAFSNLVQIGKRLFPLVALGFFCIALFFIGRFLREHSYREIVSQLHSIPIERVALAIGITFGSYLVLSIYDGLALRYVGAKLSPAKTIFASFTAFAFSNSIGLANLAGGSVRFRIYSAFGIKSGDIVRIIAFISLSFWLGFLALAGFVFTFVGLDLPDSVQIPFGLSRSLGLGFLVLIFCYLVATAVRTRALLFRGFSLELPPARLAIPQVFIGIADWTLAGLVLYILLPSSSTLTFPEFLSVFLSAQLIAMVSHVPGGIGILEAVVTYFVTPDHHPTPAVLAALVAFRAIYYFGPLLGAVAGFVGFEGYRNRVVARSVSQRAVDWSRAVAPNLMALVAFMAGGVLLVSGSTPSVAERTHFLIKLLPLPAIEISHFLGSCIGIVLLVLSRSLMNRSRGAWWLALVLLLAGSGFSLLKGYDYEEAMLLAVFAGFLYVSRHEFYRKARLFSEPWTATWFVGFAMVVIGATWIGFFVNRHVEYDNDLWWTFSSHQDAPRFLRAMAGMFATFAALGVAHLLRPPRRLPEIRSAVPEHVAELVRHSADTMANLAMVGDKRIFLSESGRSFLMYAVRGQTWVVLGDPIGDETEFEDLVHDFKELADEYGGQIVFYQIRSANLPLYIDLGMIFLKLGEEARVELSKFGLEGSSRKGLRNAYNKMIKLGISFRVAEPEEFDRLAPELRRVSDAWLKEKKTKEKGFSLGYFKEDYLRRYPIALLEREGRVLAFANLWASEGHEELSMDLMRYDPDGPHGLMEQLTLELLLWGKERGYRYFNLGMAPMSGLDTGRHGSKWNRAGRLLYDHGERFYNFQGLRRYKEKFDPVWEPRFLAYPSKISLPIVLADLAVVIAGGVKGVVSR